MKTLLRTTVVGIALLVPSWLYAASFEEIPAEEASEIGAWLLDQGSTIKDAQVKIEADVDQSNGVHIPDTMGAVVIPQKGLEESDEQNEKFQAEAGGSLAYLFTHNLVPIVDGKPVKDDQLRSITLDAEGEEIKIYVHLLAVRQVDEEEYHLYLYGKGKKPLIDVEISEGEGPGPTPVAVEVKEVKDDAKKGELVVTVFGRYQASFGVAYKQ